MSISPKIPFINWPIRFTISVPLFLLLLFGRCFSAEKLIYKIGLDKTNYPFSFEDREGRLAGFFNEYSLLLMKWIRAEYELVPMTGAAMPDELVQGIADFALPVEIPETPLKTLDYSMTVLTENKVIVVRKNRKDIKNADSLSGYVVGYTEGDSVLPYLEKVPDIVLKKYPKDKDTLSALSEDHVACCVMGEFKAEYNLKLMRLFEQFKFVKEPVAAVNYGIAVKKNNSDILNKVNNAVNRTQDTASYDRLYKKYFFAREREKRMLWSRNIAFGIIGIYLLYFLIELIIRLWQAGLKAESFVLMLRYKKRADWYRMVIENSEDMIFFLDHEHKFLLANKKTEKVLGKIEEDLMKMKFTDFIVPARQDDFGAYIANVKKYGAGKLLEIGLTDAAGREITVEFTATKHLLRRVFSGISVVCRDVTEKKKIYLDTKYLKARYMDIFNRLPAPAVLISDANIILDCNLSFSNLSGKGRDDLAGKSLEIFLVNEEKQKRDLVDKRLRMTGVKLDLLFFIGKSHRVMEVYTAEIPDERKLSSDRMVVFFDKTQAVDTEKRLENEKYFYENTVLAAAFPLVALDPNGVIIFFNEAAGKLTGYLPEVALGRIWIDLLGYNTGKKVTEALDYFERGGAIEFEDEIARREGDVKVCHFFAAYIFNAEREKYRMVFSFFDITVYKNEYAAVNRTRHLYEGILNSMPFYCASIREKDGSVLFESRHEGLTIEEKKALAQEALKKEAGDWDSVFSGRQYRVLKFRESGNVNIFLEDISAEKGMQQIAEGQLDYFSGLSALIMSGQLTAKSVFDFFYKTAGSLGIRELFVKQGNDVEFWSEKSRTYLKMYFTDFINRSPEEVLLPSGLDLLATEMKLERRIDLGEKILAVKRSGFSIIITTDGGTESQDILRTMAEISTAQAASQEQLSVEETKSRDLESFQDMTQEIIVLCDTSGGIISFNDNFRKVFTEGDFAALSDLTGGEDGAYGFIRNFIKERDKTSAEGVLKFAVGSAGFEDLAVRLVRKNGRIIFFAHRVASAGAAGPAIEDKAGENQPERFRKNIETLNYYMKILVGYIEKQNLPPDLKMYMKICEDNIKKMAN